MPYQTAWSTFFDLYHTPLRFAVLAAFRRCNWDRVSEEMLEETIADIVVSFFKAEFSYDRENGKFRNYLRQLAAWRVRDKITQLPKARETLMGQLDGETTDVQELDSSRPPDEAIEEKEREAYRSALLTTMLEDVRNRVSPQTFLMFEMTKILGHSPEEVAEQFKVKRNVVDNAVFRVLGKLKELAAQPEYRKEYWL